MAREGKLREPAATALAVAQEVARPKGLEAKYDLHWEETISISWETEGLYRMILVMVYGLMVEGVANNAEQDWQQRVEVRRGFGETNPAQAGWEEAFRQSLERAWEWLQTMDTAAVLALDKADEAHALSRIAPIVDEFATHEGLTVADTNRRRCILEWPDPPENRLGVLYAPENGILLCGYRFVTRGRLFRKPKRVSVMCGDFRDLQIRDWTQLDVLPERLAEARRRLEECIPDKDAVESYIL